MYTVASCIHLLTHLSNDPPTNPLIQHGGRLIWRNNRYLESHLALNSDSNVNTNYVSGHQFLIVKEMNIHNI